MGIKKESFTKHHVDTAEKVDNFYFIRHKSRGNLHLRQSYPKTEKGKLVFNSQLKIQVHSFTEKTSIKAEFDGIRVQSKN